MNLFEQHGVRDYAAAAAQIPVIDFGPVFAGEPGALAQIATAVCHACENVGFFYAAGHGVPIVGGKIRTTGRFVVIDLIGRCLLGHRGAGLGKPVESHRPDVRAGDQLAAPARLAPISEFT